MKQAGNDASFRLFISYCAGVVPGKSLEVQRENFSLCSYVQGKIFPYIFLIGEFFFPTYPNVFKQMRKISRIVLEIGSVGQQDSRSAGRRISPRKVFIILLCIIIQYSNMWITVEASITKLTVYHIRCFLLSKDAFTQNLAEFGPVSD